MIMTVLRCLWRADFRPGGYVCHVKKIEETTSKSGNAMLKIALDIYEGQYAGFYQDKFDSNTRLGKKWPCIFYQLIYDKDGNTNRSFKSFCEKMKESNRIEIPWGDHFWQRPERKADRSHFRQRTV